MTFNRGIFGQGANIGSMQNANKDAEQFNKKFYESSGRVGFHQILEGTNRFRIAPAHEPNGSPYHPVRTSQLEIEVDEYDNDGQKTGKKVLRRRKIFVATQHSPRDKHGQPLLKEDVIEFYIEFLTEKLKSEIVNQNEREKKLAPVRGFWSNGKYNWGIIPETKTLCYAWNDKGELKELELSKKWFDEMTALSVFAGENNPNAADIFSHIDQGSPLIIEKVVTKESGKNNKTQYKINKDMPSMSRRESWEAFFERTRVSDQQLKDLLSKKSLKILYYENYAKDDFARALEGLRRFDEKWKYGLFNNQEFLNKVKNLEAEVIKYSSDDDNKKEAKPVTTSQPQQKIEPTVTEESREGASVEKKPVEKVSAPQMRMHLKEYVKSNYGDEYQLPLLKGEELKQWYNLAVNLQDLPWESLVSNTSKPEPGPQLPESDLPWDVDDQKVSEQINEIKNMK